MSFFRKTIICTACLLIAVLFLSSCGSEPECPVCGNNGPLVECPVCSAMVCRYCADVDNFIENLYENGVMFEYLWDRDYFIARDWYDAFDKLIDDKDLFEDALMDHGYKMYEW